jgi:hypothetical protein
MKRDWSQERPGRGGSVDKGYGVQKQAEKGPRRSERAVLRDRRQIPIWGQFGCSPHPQPFLPRSQSLQTGLTLLPNRIFMASKCLPTNHLLATKE